MKILNVFGKNFTPYAARVLENLGAVDYREVTQPEIKKIINQYDVIFMGLYPELNRDVLERAKKLKVIVTATTNLDHIDLAYAKESGIAVLSLTKEIDFLNTITGTAEMAVGLMIDLCRFTPWAFDDVKNYHWRREHFRGHNLYGKTLGIVGLGRLGTWMARYGKAFNMNVIAYSPPTPKKTFVAHGVAKVNFNTLLKKSDVISIHVHLQDDTKHMFNTEAFSKMKRGAYLVNTAIREVVNERNVLTALKKRTIAGYGTDVLADELWFDEEFKKHPLVEYAKTHRNCIIVPHIGGMTHESREATDIFMAQKLNAHLRKS
ncbi:MAG: NAD(P)-dependent oxidoreductase [Patescibacteria group bacterium]